MDPKPRYLRGEAADFLTENGFPTTKNTLTKLASTGGGPDYELFGNRATYTPKNLLAWGMGKLSAPRRSTSEVSAWDDSRPAVEPGPDTPADYLNPRAEAEAETEAEAGQAPHRNRC